MDSDGTVSGAIPEQPHWRRAGCGLGCVDLAAARGHRCDRFLPSWRSRTCGRRRRGALRALDCQNFRLWTINRHDCAETCLRRFWCTAILPSQRRVVHRAVVFRLPLGSDRPLQLLIWAAHALRQFGL